MDGSKTRRLAGFARAGLVYRKELEPAEGLERQALERLQQERLTALVRHAVGHAPFYRRLYADVDTANVDLASLPVVTKADLMEHFDEAVTDRRLRLADLERHLGHVRGDELYLGEYRAVVSGGTTGVRGVAVYSRAEWLRCFAGFLRWGEMMGVRPRLPRRLRVASIGTASPLHITTRLGMSASVGLHSVLRLDVRRPLSELTAALDAFQPELLVGYASVIGLLAEEQGLGKLRIAPVWVATTSEVRTPATGNAIRAAWDPELFDIYGSTEGGVMGVDCRHHKGMHLFEDLLLFENVDEEGRPVPDGTVGRRLLVTNLFNRTQPLIRYALSDMVAVDSQRCECGRTLRRVVALEGRAEEILRFLLADGAGEVAVHPFAVETAIEELPEVLQYQVQRHGGGLSRRVVVRQQAAREEVTRRVRCVVAAKLAELHAAADVDVEAVDEIARDAGHAAKLKLFLASAPGTADVVPPTPGGESLRRPGTRVESGGQGR